ncbi:MAG: Flp pilus assembly protein CpaB [Candidatus Nanopelagicales bacterium]
MLPGIGLTRIHRFVHRWRRPLAAGCAGLAVLVALGVLRPAPPVTTDIVVAAHDLPPGVTLTADDVTVAAVPAELVVAGAYADTADVIGRLLATGMDAGEPVTASRFASGVGSGALATGEVAVPVRLADRALAEFLQPGDVIDLVAARERRGQVVAQSARVITVPRQDSSGFLAGSTTRADSLVLVAVPDRVATEVAASALAGPLAAVVRATADSR